jgi:hypothetical protein
MPAHCKPRCAFGQTESKLLRARESKLLFENSINTKYKLITLENQEKMTKTATRHPDRSRYSIRSHRFSIAQFFFRLFFSEQNDCGFHCSKLKNHEFDTGSAQNLTTKFLFSAVVEI